MVAFTSNSDEKSLELLEHPVRPLGYCESKDKAKA